MMIGPLNILCIGGAVGKIPHSKVMPLKRKW